MDNDLKRLHDVMTEVEKSAERMSKIISSNTTDHIIFRTKFRRQDLITKWVLTVLVVIFALTDIGIFIQYLDYKDDRAKWIQQNESIEQLYRQQLAILTIIKDK